MKKTLSLLLLLFIFITAWSQPLTPDQIDKLAEQTMKTFNVPGIAVAVVKDDMVVHMKGYGVTSINTGRKTDENTLFAIASNSKAFTAAALGILVDEGKITWETKVIDIIPEFRLYNAYVTEDFNIKDLLTHRSGMGLGAGDLMLWPDSSTFTREEIIHNLRIWIHQYFVYLLERLWRGSPGRAGSSSSGSASCSRWGWTGLRLHQA